ncbi:MAG TPA: M17 family peptidase N-terminal domain-containing protein, partial [Propionibacteriaceae bacterium]|nr:M17 family peptidase N-terminal domain-containing protein [Propionibacteriaceae bacterium]
MPSRALPSLAITNALPRHVDVLVVGLTTSGARQVPKTVDAAFTKRFGMSLLDMATSLGAKSSADSKRTLPAVDGGPRIVVVGLESQQPNAEDLRRAAGTGVRHAASLAGSEALSVAISFGSSDADQLAAVAEG